MVVAMTVSVGSGSGWVCNGLDVKKEREEEMRWKIKKN